MTAVVNGRRYFDMTVKTVSPAETDHCLQGGLSRLRFWCLVIAGFWPSRSRPLAFLSALRSAAVHSDAKVDIHGSPSAAAV